MEFNILILLFVFLIFFIIILYTVMVLLKSEKYPNYLEYKEEFYYLDVHTEKEFKFPSIKDDPSCDLSVIVPAYNEEERLPPMLEECLSYLENKSKSSSFTYEIIIVDDGSKDKTSQIGLDFAKKFSSEKIRVLTLHKNRGKGGAVRLGVLRARGYLILFADADGATKFSDYCKLEDRIKNLCKDSSNLSESIAVVCGSRAHLAEESMATRSYFRTILMFGFHSLVWLLAVKGVRDTQCGFKLMTRRAARVLFASLHLHGWAFDVELLYIAQTLGFPISEVAVNWTEIDGSKVTPILSWIQMGFDIAFIWLRYATGVWKIRGDLAQ